MSDFKCYRSGLINTFSIFLKIYDILSGNELTNSSFFSSLIHAKKYPFNLNLMFPIFVQIETSLFEEDISSYKTFYEEHYQQCVVKLASAVNDPVCWKTLNVELLNRTKSDNVQVCMALRPRSDGTVPLRSVTN